MLQHLYGKLSDEAMEYALLDRVSWQHFVGLAGARDLPDARTLWAFKEQLAQAGLQARGGQIIDATLITVPKTHLGKQDKQSLKDGKTPAHWSTKQAAHRDTDARWSAKRDIYSFGYKAHVNAEQQHKLIRVIEVTPANVDGRVPLQRLIDQSQPCKQTGKTVQADRGYHGAATPALLQARGLIDAVARKDDANRFDQTGLHRRNQQLARIRARVEQVLGTWEKTMGKTIRTIGSVRARAQITIQATVYNLRRWVTLDSKGACTG